MEIFTKMRVIGTPFPQGIFRLVFLSTRSLKIGPVAEQRQYLPATSPSSSWNAFGRRLAPQIPCRFHPVDFCEIKTSYR